MATNANDTDSVSSLGDEFPALESMFDPPVDSICPFGDIILVTDDKHHPTRKIQVSSCILSMVSPVFRALFSKNFAEGQSSAGEGPREIRLEEDPYTVDLLCRLLHHKVPEQIGAALPAIDMLSLAILADKYDCVAALRWQAKGLLDKFNREATPAFLGYCRTGRGDFDLAVAAYVLDQPEFFRDITKTLVLHSNKITPQSFSSESHDFIPQTMIATLSAQLQAARNVLTHHITLLLKSFSSNASYCDKQYLITQFMQSMSGLLPLDYNDERSTLAKLLAMFEGVQVPTIKINGMHCNCAALTRKNFKSPDVIEPSLDSRLESRRDRGSRSAEYGRGWGDPLDWKSSNRTPSPMPPPQSTSSEWVWKSIDDERAGWHHRLSCPHESAVDTTDIRIVEQQDVKDAAQNVRDIIIGLCLDCVKHDGEAKGECRFAHLKPWEEPFPEDAFPLDSAYLDIDCFITEVESTPENNPGHVNDGWGNDLVGLRQAPSWWEKAW